MTAPAGFDTPAFRARRVLGVNQQLGIPLPPPIHAAQEYAARVRAGAAACTVSLNDMAKPFLAAVEAGRNPAFDPDVQAAYTARQISQLNLDNLVTEESERAVLHVIKQHADDLVKGWQKPFTAAAKALTAAHARLGRYELDDTKNILALGGDIAAVYSDARQAEAVITTIAAAWTALAEYAGHQPSAQWSLLRLTDVTLDEFREWPTPQSGRTPSAWTLLRGGYSLSLPTLDEYATRVARLECDAAERVQAATKQAVQANSLTHQMPRPVRA